VKEDLLKIVEYGEIGKISFIRRLSARNLRIIIRPFREVQVMIPRAMSFENAERFVNQKKMWIKKSQIRLAKYENKVTVFDEKTTFQTHDHSLVLCKHPKPTIKTVIGQQQIMVMFPDFAEVRDPRIQHAIRKAICQALRIEAAKYLPERIHMFSGKFNLTFQKISVRDNKSRWGSCSRENNINLNIHLMRLPQHLCDYVILHELAHIRYKHHQKTFWLFLDTITQGKARILDKELNNYSPQVW
jgi:predicted metal-dependent hydrolase